VSDRLDCDGQATRQQDASLAKGSEVLGATVPVGVLGVRGPATQSHSEDVRLAATTSPLDSIPAEINARLPAIKPTPSSGSPTGRAAAIDASAVRPCTATCSLLAGCTISRA
jgi:hypothetical protein